MIMMIMPPLVSRLILLPCCLLSLFLAGAANADGQKIDSLRRAAYTNPEGSHQSLSAWEDILRLDPRSLEAHVMLGWTLMSTPPHVERGIRLLEDSFDPDKVQPVIDTSLPQTYMIAATIGRYRNEKREYGLARKFTQMALEMSARHGTNNSPSGDVCIQMQLGSTFDYIPESTEAATDAIDSLMAHSKQLLRSTEGNSNLNNWSVNDDVVSTFPGGAPDPYVHCMRSMFDLSFHYQADIALVTSSHYEMAKRGWPQLDRYADFVTRYDRIGVGKEMHPCIVRKIRLGVISGVMTEGHSNSESFGGMLTHLDRSVFDVTYIHLAEQGDETMAQFTRINPSDTRRVFTKKAADRGNGAWTNWIGEEIEEMELDIIFYSELTMSSWARRLGMQRLAPVQLNTGGHPITSGHPKNIIQYYISWEAAELPLEQAQSHYTEELKLLPAASLNQFYEERVKQGDVSRIDGEPFGHLRRADFGLPSDRNIYLCMQKPFKFMPEFDAMLCGILNNDANSWLVLHRLKNPANQQVFEKRLARSSCDLSRITFLDQQPHHRLLALYRLSAVVLDSYPAGGDTTTREALEMGKPLVTLPARLLGGRWSLGYINSIGLKEATKKALVASTPEDYIQLAVQLATDDQLREYVNADIHKSVRNLFYRQDAVEAWQDMLLEISPYERCTEIREEL